MRPLHFLADAFINTFGITKPGPEHTQRAARFIGLLLAGVLVLLTVVAFALHTAFHKP